MAEAITGPGTDTAAAPAQAAQDAITPAGLAPGAFQGWGLFQDAVNTQLVQDLRDAATLRRQTLQVLSGG